MRFSRSALVALLLFALAFPTAARALGLEKGVKLGVNFTNFRGEFADLVDTKGKLGFVGGPFVALGFTPDLAVQAEALFSMKGAKIKSTAVNDEGIPLGTFDTFIKVDYLEVAVLLRGSPLSTPVIQPMIYVGPTFGFTLGGKLATDEPGAQDGKITDLKPVDVGSAFGVGLGARIGGRPLLTDLRYTTGFTDIYHIDQSLPSGPRAESINSVFSLMVGIAF